MTINSVTLIGRLATDPKINKAGDTKICNATIAVDGLSKDADASFIPLVIFNKTAENLVKYCHKGDRIGVVGSIQTRSWETKEKEKRYTTEVVVSSLMFLSDKKDDDEDDEEEEEKKSSKYDKKKR